MDHRWSNEAGCYEKIWKLKYTHILINKNNVMMIFSISDNQIPQTPFPPAQVWLSRCFQNKSLGVAWTSFVNGPQKRTPKCSKLIDYTSFKLLHTCYDSEIFAIFLNMRKYIRGTFTMIKVERVLEQ